jgi:hypothetical protein
MDELFNFVRSGVERYKGRWPELAATSGVSYSWLTKFGLGKIPNPGHRTLEKVAAALRERGRVQ